MYIIYIYISYMCVYICSFWIQTRRRQGKLKLGMRLHHLRKGRRGHGCSARPTVTRRKRLQVEEAAMLLMQTMRW
jgi:hypothetical protein